MKYLKERSAPLLEFVGRSTGKWLVFGAVIIGAFRIISVLVWGGGLGYVIATTAVSVSLAALVYLAIVTVRR